MPYGLRLFLSYVVFRGNYLMYVAVVLIPVMAFRLWSNRQSDGLMSVDQTPVKNIPFRLNHSSDRLQFDCAKGNGDWTYICDRYTTQPNGALVKDKVGVDVHYNGYDVVPFPMNRILSRQEMRAWEREQKRFLALVDLNSGNIGKLTSLPGVDHALAKKVVAASEERAFTSVDDVRRVPGMSVQTLERIRPMVRAGLSGKPRADEYFARKEAN